jgi:acyl-CoA reductase-like NAD-dependent aldehyde dehydrogenase
MELVPSGRLYVGGNWLEKSTGGGGEHRDPTTGDTVGSYLLAGEADVDAAVGAGRDAFPQWRALAPARRRRLLLDLADAVEANAGELAAITALEIGQPLAAGTAGTVQAAEWFRYYAGWADKLEGTVAPVGSGAILDYVLPEPYGVVAAIIPWNGPIIALALKAAAALAAGNCVVLKPPEQAPFSSLRFAELCEQVGFPPGVVNVIPGGAVAGEALCRHPGVDKISFTGGTETARAVAMAAAEHQTPLVLELGGKSASLVFADADPAVAGKLAARIGVAQNSGQGCFLPTRVFVQRPRYDEVVERIVEATRKFTLGDPFEPGTTMGPVAGEAACARILDVIASADKGGYGTLLIGGGRPDGALAPGTFVEPTVFGDVDPDSPLAQDEIFGPVLAVAPFDDEEEAVALANRTRYGLAGYVWTNELGRAHRVAAALAAGYVSVNGMAALPPSAPFGGWNASGHGVEGGRWGIDEFLRLKNVHVSLR